MRVAGLDLSLTGTGIVVLSSTQRVVMHALVKTKKDEEQTYDLQERIHTIVDAVSLYCRDTDVNTIVIEDHAFHPARGSDTRPHELSGVVKYELWRLDMGFLLANISTVKKFATGKGNASKEEMRVAAGVAGFEPGAKNDNLADAYFLARWGFEEA